MTATSPTGAGTSTTGGTSRSLVGAVRRTAKDWLDRPMTSWHLITGIFVLLLGFGLLMVLSASSITSYHDNHGSPFATFENQATFAVIGLFAFIFASRFSTRMMRTYSLALVGICVLLLAAVLVTRPINGAKSWIEIGPLSFQPSEVAKLALLIWMGHVLAARRSTLRSIRALLFPVLPVFLLMVGLIMLEPDLGTTVTLGVIFIGVMWFAGAPMWMFGLLTAIAGGGIYYLATSAGYRNARILAWLHPSAAPPAATYQLDQSLYGLGHGGLFGAGLGQAMSKSGWLPNADSDFIFAVIGEELGLIGAGLLLVLYGLLAYTGLRIARRNVDPFIKIVASAATVWLVGQAAINISYVIGLLPVTGIPLPMISRGGTSLVITMVVFGMLANFARREPQAAAALHSQGPGRVASFLGLGPRPPKPAKVRKSRPAKPKAAATARPATRRAATARSDRSRRAEGTTDGGRRLPTGAGQGRGRGATDPARRTDRSRTSNRTRMPDRSGTAELPRPRREQWDAPTSGRGAAPRGSTPLNAAPRQQPPRLRRSGDAGREGDVFDWTGRPFVEPRRQRPEGSRPDLSGGSRRDVPGGSRSDRSRSDGSRSDRSRSDGSRREVSGGSRGDRSRSDGSRTGGRGRTVRP